MPDSRERRFAANLTLQHLCEGTGNLVSVKIMRNKSTQISLGYGFLEFSSHDAANTVLATFNGKSMPGTNNVFRCDPWKNKGPGTWHDPCACSRLQNRVIKDSVIIKCKYIAPCAGSIGLLLELASPLMVSAGLCKAALAAEAHLSSVVY